MSELTEDQKLVKLGLRSPNQTISIGAELLEQLKGKIAEEFDTFQENFEDANLGSFDDFETWLTNNGFDSETAANIRNNFEQKYSSFSDFKSTVLNDLDSWEDFENEFSSGSGLRSERKNDDGLSAAGIKVYEEGGVGRDGQSIAAGGVEVYGKEVHFSQSGAIQDTADESSGSSDPIVWSNLSVSPNTLFVGDKATVEADVANNTNQRRGVVAELIEDGEVIKSKSVDVLDNGIETVSFEYTATTAGTFDVGISKAGTETVQTIYGGL